jgi:uncharacterized coiled-coil protein SlyX
VAEGGITESRLNASNAPSTGQVLSSDGGDGFTWTTPAATVSTDGTLTGDGSGTPLGIADGSVGSTQLASGAVGTDELNTTGGPSGGQVLSYDGSALAWTTAAGDITDVNAGGGLTGGGSAGDVTLSIADGGVTGPRIAGTAIQAGANVEVTRDGSNNVIVGAPNALTSAVESITADGQMLSGPLQFATDGSATMSVSGNTLTFGASSSGGGLSSVATDGTLTGDGTSDNELGVADGVITATQLATNAVTSAIVADNSLTAADLADGAVGPSELNTTGSPSGGQVLGFNGTSLAWSSPSATVSTDGTTLTGDGAGTPLAIADGGVGSTQLATGAVGTSELNTAGGPSSGQVLGYDGSGLAWTTAAGDITAVTAQGGLEGGGTDGDVSLSVTDNGITEPKLNASNTPSTGQVLSSDGGDGFTWTTPAATVSTDGTLTGDGSSTPLGIADGSVGSTQLASGAVGTDELNTTGGPSGGQVLSYDGSALAWTSPSSTVTTDGSTLTGDGSGGDPLRILNDGVGADQLAPGAVGSDEVADASLAAGDLNVAGTPGSGDVLAYDGGTSGNLTWQAAGSTTSSIRFKTEVRTIADAQSLIERLRGVRYQWTADGRADLGLIAEEVATVLPELVVYEADGTTVRGLRYGPLVGVLIEAAKAQQAALDAASDTVARQQDEIESLSDRLARLEALVQSMQAESSSAQK